MKRIIVEAYEIALVLKRGKLINLFVEGRHWIGLGTEVRFVSILEPFRIDTLEWNLFSKSPILSEHLKLVVIDDNMFGIQWKDGQYDRVLNPGTYGFWNSPIQYNVDKIDLNEVEVLDTFPKFLLNKSEILAKLKVYPVESYEKGLLYVDGIFVKLLESGLHYFWKTNEVAIVKTIDTRIQSLDLSGQELLTKDKVGIRINFVAQYQVVDIDKALIETKDYQKQLYENIQLGLREYIGTLTMDQLLASKEKVGPYVKSVVDASIEMLGVKLFTCGIKDVILPGDVKSIMNQVLIAQKKAQANTIMRQEETASTRSLLNTAKLMEQNTMLMKLKELEYMEKISEKIGEITINGGSDIIGQLRELVVVK